MDFLSRRCVVLVCMLISLLVTVLQYISGSDSGKVSARWSFIFAERFGELKDEQDERSELGNEQGQPMEEHSVRNQSSSTPLRDVEHQSATTPLRYTSTAVPSAHQNNATLPSFRDYVNIRAVVVDPHWDAELEAIIANFLSVLSEDIPVRWYNDRHIPEWSSRMKRAPVIQAVKSGRLDQQQVGQTLNKAAYNAIRLKAWFYKSTNAKHALLFERDSVLCKQSPHTIGDFTNYDYIGAPWPGKVSWCKGIDPARCCCNSGLALVNTRSTIDILAKASKGKMPTQNDMFMLDINRGGRRSSFRIADRTAGSRFAVESGWDGGAAPFGVHKPWWALHEFRSVDLAKLRTKCPEIELLCPYAYASRNERNSRHGPPARTFSTQVCNRSVR